MTTIKDIWILQATADKMTERYNRRCRRIVALLKGGRKVEHYNWDNTDCMRLAMESARRDLDAVMTAQAMAASVGD